MRYAGRSTQACGAPISPPCSRQIGAMAAETGVTKFIYMSSGSVYASQTRKPADVRRV